MTQFRRYTRSLPFPRDFYVSLFRVSLTKLVPFRIDPLYERENVFGILKKGKKLKNCRVEIGLPRRPISGNSIAKETFIRDRKRPISDTCYEHACIIHGSERQRFPPFIRCSIGHLSPSADKTSPARSSGDKSSPTVVSNRRAVHARMRARSNRPSLSRAHVHTRAPSHSLQFYFRRPSPL